MMASSTSGAAASAAPAASVGGPVPEMIEVTKSDGATFSVSSHQQAVVAGLMTEAMNSNIVAVQSGQALGPQSLPKYRASESVRAFPVNSHSAFKRAPPTDLFVSEIRSIVTASQCDTLVEELRAHWSSFWPVSTWSRNPICLG